MLIQKSTIIMNDDGSVKSCSNATDDTGYYIYRDDSNGAGGNGVKGCSGLDFSKIAEDGSNLYKFAAHAYDAIYSLAYAVEMILEQDENQFSNLNNGKLLHDVLCNNVSFDGASGYIKYFIGKNAVKLYCMFYKMLVLFLWYISFYSLQNLSAFFLVYMYKYMPFYVYHVLPYNICYIYYLFLFLFLFYITLTFFFFFLFC